MKTLIASALLVGLLGIPSDASAQNEARGCGKCAQEAALASDNAEAVSVRPIEGTGEQMVVGRIENLLPIGVVIALGCETCAEKTVHWALQQGSSIEDVSRALRTVAAVLKLDCFKQQFGARAGSQLERPLAAAMRALQQATETAAK